MTQAGSFTWDLPDDARIVALVHDSAERERSSTVVDAIATSIGRHREHTLVMSTEPGPTPLDELAGVDDSEGWPAFFADRQRLSEIAAQHPERPYVYLSAGRDAESVTGFLLDDIFLRFIERVRERGGTLLLVICERTPIASGLGRHLDGYVALGDIRRADSDEFDYYGRVRFEADDAAGDAADDAATASAAAASYSPSAEHAPASPEDGTASPTDAPDPDSAADAGHAAAEDGSLASEPETPRRRRAARRRLPRRLIIWVLVVVAVVAGGVWLSRNLGVIRGLRPGTPSDTAAPPTADDPAPDAGDTPAAGETPPEGEATPAATIESPEQRSPDGAPADEIGAGSASAESVPGEADANGGDVDAGGGLVGAGSASSRPALDPAGAALAFDAAPERPYSVLVRSLGDAADAANHAAELRSATPGLLYFTAPTPVEGILYHRIFAGALRNETEAAAVLESLARAGAVDGVNTWQLRPVRLAYDLGVFTESSEAEARIAELAARNIPAYRLAVSVDGRAIFRVYAGAYEDERAALPLAGLLEAAGEVARLVPRRGDETSPNP